MTSFPAAEIVHTLHALFAAEWEFRLQDNPLLATYVGDHRFNDRYPGLTDADFDRRLEQALSFQAQLAAIDRSALPPAEQLNYDIFQRELWMQIQEHRFGLHFMPITRLSGFHISLPDMILVTRFDTAADYELYLQRLAGLEDYFEANIDLMRQGAQQGRIPPRAALHGADDAVRNLISADPAQSVYFRPFQSFSSSISPADQVRLAAAGKKLILAVVNPAHLRLAEFLHTEYLPAARLTTAVYALPDGAALYEYYVRRYTTLNVTPQEVHDTGLSEVRRIRQEMQALMQQTGFKGSFQEFIQFLRSDPRFFVQTPEALMKEVAWIMKRMDGELPRLFKTLPRTPYGMRQIPDYLAPTSTTAYYFPATGDGLNAGYYYVNTYDLTSRPLFEYEALSFHEAVPGHHLQLALQLEMQDVPQFRRFTDVTAFVEGWALYAERLGLEVGFYQDVYSNFGRLTFEIWRACRLVVDTGLHALGWSRQQAIDFMTENTSLAALNIANEVDRYIAWPGQALAYKMGELKVRALRQMAEQALGERFDLRQFHDVLLLQGAIPLDVLETRMQDWISQG